MNHVDGRVWLTVTTSSREVRHQAVPKEKVLAAFTLAPVIDAAELRADVNEAIGEGVRDPFEGLVAAALLAFLSARVPDSAHPGASSWRLVSSSRISWNVVAGR
jgi:hypothetical protein